MQIVSYLVPLVISYANYCPRSSTDVVNLDLGQLLETDPCVDFYLPIRSVEQRYRGAGLWSCAPSGARTPCICSAARYQE